MPLVWPEGWAEWGAIGELLGGIAFFLIIWQIFILRRQTRQLANQVHADLVSQLKDFYTSKGMRDAVKTMWDTWRETKFGNQEEFYKSFSKDKVLEAEQMFRTIVGHFDKIGFLAYHKLLNKDLALRLVHSTVEIWKVIGPVRKSLAEKLGTSASLIDYFEWLSKEWDEFKKNPKNFRV